MANFVTHTEDTAPIEALPIISKMTKSYGFLPNLLGTMAESPALLEAYTTLAGIFDKTSLTQTERQVVMMTNNLLNDCEYCMAAHSVISKMNGVEADVIESLRNNTALADPQLEALRQFTITVNKTRGWPEQQAVEAFLNAGYTEQNILEVILGTSLKVLSNYTNHIAQTPLDDAFKPAKWSKEDLQNAA